MCWSLEVSLVAALWGYGVSLYLRHRKYSIRDPWYALFLATFTSTQMLDAFFWYIKGENADIPCTEANFRFSRYVVPPVVFFQPVTLVLFPSQSWKKFRVLYFILTLVGCAVPMITLGCSTLWTPTGLLQLPTILYGGVYPPFWIIFVGVGFWAAGAAMFVRPMRACFDILAVGTVVLTLLFILDGSLRLISKMCTYCLILSFVWLLEPLWMPPSDPSSAPSALTDIEEQMMIPLATPVLAQ